MVENLFFKSKNIKTKPREKKNQNTTMTTDTIQKMMKIKLKKIQRKVFELLFYLQRPRFQNFKALDYQKHKLW